MNATIVSGIPAILLYVICILILAYSVPLLWDGYQRFRHWWRNRNQREQEFIDGWQRMQNYLLLFDAPENWREEFRKYKRQKHGWLGYRYWRIQLWLKNRWLHLRGVDYESQD